MPSPLDQLGIARRPAYQMFGTPDMSKGGWSTATKEAVLEDQAAEDELQAVNDQREERRRAREAERAADEYSMQETPSARQKFFEETPALVNSKRYGAIADYERRQPSYADRTLMNQIATRYKDPAVHQTFMDAVGQGYGTLEAQRMADSFAVRQKADSDLAKAGYPRKEREAILAKGYDPAEVEYHIAQKEQGTMFHRDPQAQAMENHLKILKNRAAFELKTDGAVSDETEAAQLQLEAALANKYQQVYTAPAAPSGAAPAAIPATPAAPATPSPAKLPSAVDQQLQEVPYGQEEQFLRQQQADAPIAQAWQEARNKLGQQIQQIIPDAPFPGTNTNQLERFARAVLDDKRVALPHKEGDEIRVTPTAWKEAAARMGLGPLEDKLPPAFTEPGNKRTFGPFGSQEVQYEELFKDWAKQFLNSRGKLLPASRSPTGAKFTPEQQKAFDKFLIPIRSK